MIPQKREQKLIGAQKTEISISAGVDFGEMKKTEVVYMVVSLSAKSVMLKDRDFEEKC